MGLREQSLYYTMRIMQGKVEREEEEEEGELFGIDDLVLSSGFEMDDIW